MTDKKQLRKELITKKGKKITDEEFSNKSLRICNRLFK